MHDARGAPLLPLQALLQLHGVDGSFGHALEDLMRPHLSTLFGGASQRGGTLVERDGALMYFEGGVGDPRPFAPMHHLREILALQAAQAGVADLVLFPRSGDDDTDADSADDEKDHVGDRGSRRRDPRPVVFIDAWQCKAPEVGTVATWGDLTAATSAIAGERKLPKTLDPVKFVCHAVAKAMWGFCNVASLLTAASTAVAPASDARLAQPGVSTAGSSSLPVAGVRFVPRRLHLLTTAVLSPAAQSDLTDHALTGYAFPPPLVEAFNASRKGRGRKLDVGDAARWRLHVTACDGVGWLGRHLPPDVSSQFVTPTLHGREAAAREQAARRGGVR